MTEAERVIVKHALWYIHALALSRKTGAIKALVEEVAGKPKMETGRKSKEPLKKLLGT